MGSPCLIREAARLVSPCTPSIASLLGQFLLSTPASGAGTSLTAENCLLPGLLVNFLVSVFFPSVYFPNI